MSDTDNETPSVYVEKTEEELSQLAKDMYAGNVFTSNHISPKEVGSLLSSIFMPMALINDEGIKYIKDNKITLLYEYLSNAGPRSVNGYPMFMSMRYLNDSDTAKMIDKYNHIKALMDAV